MSKLWGRTEYWGLGSEYDPDWILTEGQKRIRDDLMEVCRKKIRPLAAECDKNYKYPRESMDALADLGLLSLTVPKDMGGLGENHVCMAMVLETIARYGCPATALVYTMHLLAVNLLLMRHHDNDEIQNLLRRVDEKKLIGSVAFSDPATGGHFWSYISSKTKFVSEDQIKVLKYGSWCTSAGYADWYFISLSSSDFSGDYSKITNILVYGDEVRASSDDWEALGMHANMSGSIIIEGTFSSKRIIGKVGEEIKSIDEVAPLFLLVTGACWNGIAMACMDVAKKHVTRKALADAGKRICDYATIQDYFGECIAETNSCRVHTFMTGQIFDKASDNADWTLMKNHDFCPRAPLIQWGWQSSYCSRKNVFQVSDRMLQACGGAGYKSELGLERLLRDARAGWVMSPSNEILRNMLGKAVLCGLSSIDIWEQQINERVLHHELKKMTLQRKKELIVNLQEDVANNEGSSNKHPFQESDFENPFHTCPPSCSKSFKTKDGTFHEAALQPNCWKALALESSTHLSEDMVSFKFDLPNKTDHTGCLPGQYVRVKINTNGRSHTRYLSPVSPPDDFGRIEVALKFETRGIVSNHFQKLKPGDTVEFQGPCGGFEYEPNKLDMLTLLTSGGGVTPALQLIRCILKNPKDKTKVILLYSLDSHKDIPYKKELDHYAAANQRLQVVYTLVVPPEDWEGEEGFIDTKMIDKYVPKSKSLRHKIVMCGGTTMVISCLHSLQSLGFPSDCIFIYGQFGTELVKVVYGRNCKLSGHNCNTI